MTNYQLTDTEETIRPTMPEEDAKYAAIGETYSEVAKAILATKLDTLTSREETECRTAAGEDTGRMGFNCCVIDALALQFSKEITTYLNEQ
jgi:hypothetical protein